MANVWVKPNTTYHYKPLTSTSKPIGGLNTISNKWNCDDSGFLCSHTHQVNHELLFRLKFESQIKWSNPVMMKVVLSSTTMWDTNKVIKKTSIFLLKVVLKALEMYGVPSFSPQLHNFGWYINKWQRWNQKGCFCTLVHIFGLWHFIVSWYVKT